MEEELKEQVEKLNNSTITLQHIYKKISTLLKERCIYAIVYLLLNISFIYIKLDSLIILITYTVIVCFFYFILFIYGKMISKYKNHYEEEFNYGYKIWCILSDKLDWGNIRRKILYQEYKKDTYETLIAINDFYYEFQKKYSPMATQRNYFKYINRGIYVIYILGILLFLSNVF